MMIQRLRDLAALLLAFAAFVLAFQPGGAQAQQFVAGQIEKLISTDAMQVKIEGLTGALSGNVRIERVTVSDPAGVFLTASDLAMDWSPFALVRSNVAIQALTAGRIELSRLPQSQPAAEPGKSSGLPNITAEIQRLAIAEFVLGEAVAGVPARLSAEARLVLQNEPTRLEVNATVQRLDQPGSIAANVVYAPADNRLTLDVKASEPAGGLVASLLKIPGAPPVDLTVNGNGPLSAFMANGSLNVGGENAATLTARVDDVAEGRKIAAALTVTAERFVPKAYASYVRGGLNLDLDLVARNDGLIQIAQGRLASDAIQLDVTGALDRSGPQSALDLTLASRDGATIPLRFGTAPNQTVLDVASLKGRLGGALSAADIDLRAALPVAGFGAYVASGVDLHATGSGFNLSGPSGPLTIEASAASMTAPEGTAQRFLQGPIAITATGALAPGSLTLSQSRLSTKVANAAITGTAALNFSTFDLALSSDFETLALSAAAVPLAGDRLAVSGNVTRTPEGALNAQNLAVRGTGLTIEGSASLNGEMVVADVKGTIDAAADGNAGFSGQAAFALTASGPSAQPDVDISLTSQGLKVGGRELADLKVEARGAFTGATPSGTVDISGLLDGKPLSGAARVTTQEDGQRRISDLAIRQDANTITGDILLTQAFVPVGKLNVAVADIGPLAALALQQMSGDLNGTINLSVDGQDFPVADVALDAGRLTVAGTSLKTVAVDLAVTDYLGQPFPAGTITAETIEAGSANVRDLAIDLKRDGDATRLAAKASANGVPVALAGQARIAPGETVVTLDSLTAAIEDAAVSLAQPSSVTIAGGETRLSGLDLKVGAGSIVVGGSAGQTLNIDAKLNAVPVAVANPFVAGLQAEGIVSGTAKVTGAASDPAATFDIRAETVETSQTRAAKAGPVDATLAGDYGAGTLTLREAEAAISEGRLSAAGSLGQTLDVTATLDRIPVALANGFVSGLDASGTVSGTATATGTTAQPDATFALTGTGITAREIAAAGVPPVELDIAGRYANALLTLERGRATVGTGVLEARGTVGAQQLDLDARLTEIPVGLINGFVPGLKASGTISGTATAAGTTAAPTARFDITGSGITAEAVAKGGVPPLSLRVAGSFADGTARLEMANARIGEASINAKGSVGQTIDLDVNLDNVPVALANGFVEGLDASGTLSGSVRATGPTARPNGSFELTGRGITARGIAASGIDPITLDVAGTIADGTATFQTARADIGEGSLSATGRVGQEIDLKLVLDALPVGIVNGFVQGLGASGTLSGSADATGTLAAPQARFQLKGRDITTTAVKASGIDPATLDVAGRYDAGTAELSIARVVIGSGTIEAKGTVGQMLDLDLTLNDLPVALANGFVPNLNATGRIDGRAKATGSLANPSATFQLKGDGITARDIKASGIAPITLDIAGTYENGTARIETGRVKIGDGSLEATGTVGQALDMKATLTRIPVALANGFVPDLGARGTISGSASATGSLADPRAVFDLQAADISVAQTRAAGTPALKAVAKGHYSDASVALETARVDVGGGSITATGKAGRTLDLDVVIADLPASIASAAASGIDPTGTIRGRVRATGSAAAPNVEYDLNVSGLTVAQTRDAGVGPLAIAANGRFAEQRLTLDANLSGSGLAFRAGGSVGLAGTPEFDLTLNGTAPLSIANRVLAEGGRSVKGTAAVDLRVTGTSAQPNIVGRISTSGASFVDTGANLAINSIATVIDLNGQTATISSFSARIASGGTVTVGGTVGLADGFPADIRARIAGGRYNDGELIAAQLDADLTLDGALASAPRLAGTINARSVNILVPDRLPTSLARIDVRHKNAPAAVLKQSKDIAPKSAKGAGTGGGLLLDVTLNAPREVFVRGRGLDIELGGSIRVQGSSSAPQINGAFDLKRGRFQILGNRLDFERGRLTFSGELVPTLDLLATSDSGDVTISIAVTGPATDPSFNFSSSPALPQDEVLARLIFKQGTANLSPLQIAQLAEAAAQLAGVGGSTGLLENLRSQLGVDDLDIKTNADGQTAVGVGKYINDNTYVGVDSTGRVSIDLDIGKGVKARGAVTATGGGEVGIFYENEY